jgi:hypothetical protein
MYDWFVARWVSQVVTNLSSSRIQYVSWCKDICSGSWSERIYISVFHGQYTQTKSRSKTKNETTRNCWTRRPCSQSPPSDDHETGYAFHQQCIAVIFRHTKTACWKSLPSIYPCQWYSAMIHIHKSKAVFPVAARKPCREGRCITPLILKFGAKCWMISFTPRSLCPLKRTLIPIGQGAGFSSEPVCTIWRNEESLAPGGIQTANLQLIV